MRIFIMIMIGILFEHFNIEPQNPNWGFVIAGAAVLAAIQDLKEIFRRRG